MSDEDKSKENTSSSGSETNTPIKTNPSLAITKLTASTPLSTFDRTRLDLEKVKVELSKLGKADESSSSETPQGGFSDDTTLIDYHTPRDSTAFNSSKTTPGEVTPTLEKSESSSLLSTIKLELGNKTEKKEENQSPSNLVLHTELSVDTIESSLSPSPKISPKMALTSAQYSDIIPMCKDVKDVEQFVTIVQDLYAEVGEGNKRMFLAIVRAKITGKAFDAIKGKDTSTWPFLKETLTKGLEEKVDMATASNKLTHIKQLPNEKLKNYIERIKEALAVLNRTAIRQFTEEAVKNQILSLNDATAKNTFEAGLIDIRLKTVVVAAQKETFNDSYNFATNQQHTNFPQKKGDDKKSDFEKKGNCFKCGKSNHYANECYSNRDRLRSRSLPGRPNDFKPDIRAVPNPSNNRFYGNTANSVDNRNIRPVNSSNNPNPNGYNSNNRNNWPRPGTGQGFNQSKSQNFGNSNSNRGTQGGNRPFNSNRNTIRIIRENQADWGDIIPLSENRHGAGNE